jgi:oligopeptide/dipeptide ABC transporter ATP-binding protein
VSLVRRSRHLEFPDISTFDRPLLEVEDLHTSFDTQRGLVRAVDGVSFQLERARTLGIVGESGSGKTVLLRSIMGLLPGTTVRRSGRVIFTGHDLTSLSNTQLRDVWGTQISLVFQDPMTALNPVVRVGRQITESLRLRAGLDRSAARETAITLLSSVGIPDPKRRLRAYPHELSGGMRQRVMIAIAIACSPRLLLADEPTTGLDVTVQAQMLSLLRSLQAERSMALILVTHDLSVVAGFADEIAVMYAGRIVEQGPTELLFSRTRMPYTEALLGAIPRLSQPSHSLLRVIPGRPPDLAIRQTGCAFAPRCAYVQPRCRQEVPSLRTAETGHRFACWYPVGTPEGEAALAANLAAGIPAARALSRSRTAIATGISAVCDPSPGANGPGPGPRPGSGVNGPSPVSGPAAAVAGNSTGIASNPTGAEGNSSGVSEPAPPRAPEDADAPRPTNAPTGTS